MCPGGTQPGQSVRILGRSLDDPPGGRGRGHRPEQLRLIRQGGQVGKAVATIGQHHRHVPQHVRVAMTTLPATRVTPAKRPGQPEPVGQFHQECRAGMPDHPDAVGGDFEPDSELVACTPKVPSLSR
jgi:hypothetical protein